MSERMMNDIDNEIHTMFRITASLKMTNYKMNLGPKVFDDSDTLQHSMAQIHTVGHSMAQIQDSLKVENPIIQKTNRILEDIA